MRSTSCMSATRIELSSLEPRLYSSELSPQQCIKCRAVALSADADVMMFVNLSFCNNDGKLKNKHINPYDLGPTSKPNIISRPRSIEPTISIHQINFKHKQWVFLKQPPLRNPHHKPQKSQPPSPNSHQKPSNSPQDSSTSLAPATRPPSHNISPPASQRTSPTTKATPCLC